MNAQQVYLKYLSKEFTVDDFLYHMRRDPLLKECISPSNSPQDVVTILKQKGKISDPVQEDIIMTEEKPEEESSEEESKKESYHYNAPENEYKWYVCELLKDKIVINEGFTYENDAKDRIKEQKAEGHTDGLIFKVISGKFLKSHGVDPDDDKNWGNPSYMKESFGDLDDGSKKESSEESNTVGGETGIGLEEEDSFSSEKGKKKLDDLAKDFLGHAGGSKQKAIELIKKRTEEIKKQTGSVDYMKRIKPYYLKALQIVRSMIEKSDTASVVADPNTFSVNEAKNPNDGLQNGYNRQVKLLKKKPTADDINYYEFTRGWRYELEKTDDIDKAKEKAVKNIAKDPMYYSNLLNKLTTDKQGEDRKINDKKLKFKEGDRPEVKDKINQMKNVKKNAMDKKNTTGTVNKEMTKSISKSKLNSALKNIIKEVLSENAAYSDNVKAMQDMIKMDPTELASQVIAGINQMSKIRKEFAGKVLGKAIADGNKDQKVIDAFHKVSDAVNERVGSDIDPWKDAVLEILKKKLKADDSQAEKIFSHFEKDFAASHQKGDVPEQAVAQFLKNVKKVKEEFQDNTYPEKASIEDMALQERTEEKHFDLDEILGPDIQKYIDNIDDDSSIGINVLLKIPLKVLNEPDAKGGIQKVLKMSNIQGAPAYDQHGIWAIAYGKNDDYSWQIDIPAHFEADDSGDIVCEIIIGDPEYVDTKANDFEHQPEFSKNRMNEIDPVLKKHGKSASGILGKVAKKYGKESGEFKKLSKHFEKLNTKSFKDSEDKKPTKKND